MHLWISLESLSLLSNAQTRVGGYYFLGNCLGPSNPLGEQCTIINALICVKLSALCNVIGAVSESEIARARVNARLGVRFRIILMEIAHPQLITLLERNNAISFSILNKQLILEYLKAIDTRFFSSRIALKNSNLIFISTKVLET